MWLTVIIPGIPLLFTGVAPCHQSCSTLVTWGSFALSYVSHCCSKTGFASSHVPHCHSTEWFHMIPGVTLLVNWIASCLSRCTTAFHWGLLLSYQDFYCHSLWWPCNISCIIQLLTRKLHYSTGVPLPLIWVTSCFLRSPKTTLLSGFTWPQVSHSCSLALHWTWCLAGFYWVVLHHSRYSTVSQGVDFCHFHFFNASM